MFLVHQFNNNFFLKISVARDLKATNEIVALLRMQLAEAHNLGDRNMVAQLHETLRCLSLFDNEACRKLVRSLKEDYKRRSPYLAYLGKLGTLKILKRLYIYIHGHFAHFV